MTKERFIVISVEEGIPTCVAGDLWDNIDFESNDDEERLRLSHRKMLATPDLKQAVVILQAQRQ